MVVGGGSAGLTAARFGADVGARVALLEREHIGGDCTWTGCVPSKTLLRSATVAHNMANAGRYGLTPCPPEVELAPVMAHVRATIQAVYAHETPETLRQRGIDVHLGEASFIDPHTLRCGDTTVSARRVVVATGARPTTPAIPGLRDAPFVTYSGIFDVDHLPPRLAVLGGGPIGVELGQAFQRLGSQVTIFDQQARLLPAADPEASEVLAKCLENEGMTLRLGVAVQSVARAGGGVVVRAGGVDQESDLLLVATGRLPVLEGLALDRAGVETSGPRIRVNGRLQTSVPTIYAAGDVASDVQFTHYAAFQGYAAARNALFPGGVRGQHEGVPWVAFTDPEVGHAGTTEVEARGRGEAVRVDRIPMQLVDRAQTTGQTQGFIKVVSRPGGRVIGGVVVAADAAALTNELALAIRQRMKLGRLATTIHAYPSLGTGLQQLASDAAMQLSTRAWRSSLLRAIARRGR